MAELMTSSSESDADADDASVGVTTAYRHDEGGRGNGEQWLTARAKGAGAGTETKRSIEEPEQEWLTAFLSPAKTDSPPAYAAATSSAAPAKELPLISNNAKPVISARAKLMKLVPSTLATDTEAPPIKSPLTAYRSSIRSSSLNKRLSQDVLHSGGDEYRSDVDGRAQPRARARAKRDSYPPSSESERIARKYGLRPSHEQAGNEVQRKVSASTGSASDGGNDDDNGFVGRGGDDGGRKGGDEAAMTGRRSFSSPMVTHRPSPARGTPSGITTSTSTEAGAGADASAGMAAGASRSPATPSDSVYASPFAGSRASIPSTQQRKWQRTRQRRSFDPRDKEAFYHDKKDDGRGFGLESRRRPLHVIGSRITETIQAAHGDDGVGTINADDDDWLSDAQDLNGIATAAAAVTAQQKQSSPPPIPSKRVRARGRPRKRPRAGSSSSDENEQELACDGIGDRWPLLPPAPKALKALTLTAPSGDTAQVCGNVNSYLFDYQREGAQFLFDAYTRGTGAILGDEMGLGKTIQVIAFLAAILRKQGNRSDEETWTSELTTRRKRQRERQSTLDGEITLSDIANGTKITISEQPEDIVHPILIVVPASLLHNWDSELRVWMSCCTVILYGKPEDRGTIMDRVESGEYEIVICSYDILKTMLARISQIAWDVIILDEMHCLKNPESQLTQAVKRIPCKRKLGLTGTLMQNNEKELHCLLDTIAPGVLGSWSEFRAYYGDDIKYGRKKSAAREAVERSREKEKALRLVLQPYYLRREKEINPSFQEVKKCDQVVFCELTPFQLAAYKRILDMSEFELLRRGEEPCDCGRDSKRKRKSCCYQTPTAIGASTGRALLWERFHPKGEACRSCPNCMGLVCMAQLLKLSNHMELLKVNPHDPPELQEYQSAFAAAALGDDVDAVGGVRQVSTFHEMRAIGNSTCGKMVVLEKLLAVWKRKRQKTLLFSRSTRMLDILQLFLIGKAVTYVRLDGNTKVDERLQLVNRFNDPESNLSVFLISTRAGGLGLNLPTATNVVLFDPSWNPAHDCQAQDRAYRIGQTKDVQVYRLITLGTIEEMIYVRQIYKQQLSDTTLKGVQAPRYFEGVQGDRRQQGELFGIKNLLCWKEGGVLKDIQDAYRRDQDDLVIQVNQVQYDEAKQQAASSSASRSGRKRRRSRGEGPGAVAVVDAVDAEMVEVADEMTAGLLSQEKRPDDSVVRDQGDDLKAVGNGTREEEDIATKDDEGGTQACFLQGTRTFMHNAIVGDQDENDNTGPSFADAFSETDNDADVDVKDYIPTENQVDEDPVVSPAASTSSSVAIEATEPEKAPQPPGRGLYIPKYL